MKSNNNNHYYWYNHHQYRCPKNSSPFSSYESDPSRLIVMWWNFRSENRVWSVHFVDYPTFRWQIELSVMADGTEKTEDLHTYLSTSSIGILKLLNSFRFFFLVSLGYHDWSGLNGLSFRTSQRWYWSFGGGVILRFSVSRWNSGTIWISRYVVVFFSEQFE